MVTFTKQIPGLEAFLQLFLEPFLTGRLTIPGENISVKFHGNPWPLMRINTDKSMTLTWNEKVEVDMGKFIDPDVQSVRLSGEKLEINFAYGKYTLHG